MACEKIFETIESLYEEYVQIWEDISNIESPTSYKEGVDAVGKYIIALAEKKGWKVDICPQAVSGDAICITMNADATEAPVSLSGHLDTVQPLGSFGTPAVRKDAEKMYGPGVHDCKGGVVVALLTMDALARCGYNKRPVQLLLQTDEETGSRGSNKETIKWICKMAEGSVGFFNLEGHGVGKAGIERKGIARYEITVSGKQAHSGKCDDGANAIAQAAHMLLELEKFKDRKTLTCNCGTIVGGSTPNTVPGSCTFVADFRYSTQEDKDVAEEAVKKVTSTVYVEGCTASYKLMSYRVSMPLRQRNLDLLDKVNEILAKEGLVTLIPNKLTGGSDASDVSAAGIPVLDNLGICGGKSHSENEFAHLRSLASCAKQLSAIVYNI
ncbi:MAG: M20/M25/M40 family metallo-hydrolase [Oscillospiraceae bacterium]|nr:M20/M25/M40 family metallo-hydrolase [Oscillospiraceae bacterium]